MGISGVVSNVRISGIACAVPKTRVLNESFVLAFGPEQMAKFEKMVGVKERRFSDKGQTTEDLAFAAADVLRKSSVWMPENVDGIIFVSQTPSRVMPATACDLQRRLGIKKDCIAYDINLGCSGFVYGVFVASSHLQMTGMKRILLLGGETASKLCRSKDPASAPLFGDAGFAMVLDRDESAAVIRYSYKTDGGGANAIKCNFGEQLVMDGMEVFNFTINEVPDMIKSEMTEAQMTADQIDYLVLHQANRFVLKNVGMATGFNMKKIPVSMDRYGNTSSASIPLTLCDMAASNAHLGVKTVLMSGFGVGLSWGTLITRFDFSRCHGIVEV